MTLNGSAATVADLKVGDFATVRRNPESGELRQVIVSRKAGRRDCGPGVGVRSAALRSLPRVRRGRILRRHAAGTAGGQATFDIGNFVTAVTMREDAPGAYRADTRSPIVSTSTDGAAYYGHLAVGPTKRRGPKRRRASRLRRRRRPSSTSLRRRPDRRILRGPTSMLRSTRRRGRDQSHEHPTARQRPRRHLLSNAFAVVHHLRAGNRLSRSASPLRSASRTPPETPRAVRGRSRSKPSEVHPDALARSRRCIVGASVVHARGV